MNRNQVNRYLCALVTTVAEAGDKGAPSGPMYASFMTQGATLEEYEFILSLACQGGLVTEKSHLVHITPKGKEMASKIEAFAKQ